VELRLDDEQRKRLSAASLDGSVERIEELPDRVLLYVAHGDDALRYLHDLGVTPQSALVRRASLEDVFLTITGRSLVE
jgi:lipooligosaccharide transport system ATP-binding protein